MHPSLLQFIPCIQMCSRIEEILMRYRIQAARTNSEGQEGGDDFALVHRVVRGNRAVNWGLSYTLDPAVIREGETYTLFFIFFQDGEKTVLDLDYDPVGDGWSFAATREQQELIEEFLRLEKDCPEFLFKRIIPTERGHRMSEAISRASFHTAHALQFISKFTKWYLEMNSEVPPIR